MHAQVSEKVAALAASQRDSAAKLASLVFRASQSAKMNPAIIAILVPLIYALRDRVPLLNLLAWASLVLILALWRSVQARIIRQHAAEISGSRLRRHELAEVMSSVLGSYAIGSSFWLLALPGDVYVEVLVTLLSMAYVLGAFVHATPDASHPVLRASGVVGQGVLYWLFSASGGPIHWAILALYCAVTFMAYQFARQHLRQMEESLRIRGENAALLLQAEEDKKLIERALNESKLANEAKSRFLAAASHDLRQPLHALTMFLGTMTFHVTTDDARRLLGRIKETVHVLEEQFNSLLDLSRFDAGAVAADIKAFRLDAQVERVIEEFRPLAAAKHLEIAAAICPAIARSDPLLIARVLRNLLDNAVKYTAAGSVRVRVSDQQDSFLVEIEDTGPGIPADQQTRIFDEYVQLTNPGRQRQRGVGLGLAIVKRIDNLLGLKLALQSASGAGSRFSFVAPVATDVAGARDEHGWQSQPNAAAFRTAASIWILDDDRIALDGLQAQLSAWGASVTAFATPEELLAQLRAGAPVPHWILSDDMLGASLSGLETAQILSRQFGFGKVCLVTGNTEPARLAQLRSSGFPVIVKPAKPEEIIAVIES
jgi:two-component system, sensor histidine kinase